MSKNCKREITLTSQIEEAIGTPSVHIAIFSVHIAIFSPRYAESNWCFKEIVLKVEFRTTIIQVFYSVQPSELRWTHRETGLYDRVLSMLPWNPYILRSPRGENGVYVESLWEIE